MKILNSKLACAGLTVLALGLTTTGAGAQSCPANFCQQPVDSLCDAGGFRVTLTNFTPASTSTSGYASYTYQVCSPPAGTCSGNANRTCLDHGDCGKHGEGTCSRQCAVEEFHDLSHFDVFLPPLGLSCLGENTDIRGSCTPGPFSVGQDGSCGNPFVAKCDAGLNVGECYSMTIEIAGETTAPGLGAALIVSKESRDCNQNCILGPSCQPCNGGPPQELACLTRTAGFWGTHPRITEQFLNPPLSVCGQPLDVVTAGTCNSATEALCVSPGQESKDNRAYAQLVRQLTAAKLNLAATAANGGFCGAAIEARIAACERLCGASQRDISASGCIEDLNAFNNSVDSFPVTPPPFDSPGPAYPGFCQEANGNGVVIGKGPHCP